MGLEYFGRKAGKFFLLLLEYCFKFVAAVVSFLVLGTDGSFGTKLTTGLGSLSPTLRKIFETPEKITNMAAVIHDYNSLTAAAFNEQYGAQAVEGVLMYLNEGIVYSQTVYQNFMGRPFATIFATGIAFFIPYILARVLRFARQQGEGSYFTRLERRLGDRIFRPSPKIPQKPSARPEQKTSSLSRLRQKFS